MADAVSLELKHFLFVPGGKAWTTNAVEVCRYAQQRLNQYSHRKYNLL